MPVRLQPMMAIAADEENPIMTCPAISMIKEYIATLYPPNLSGNEEKKTLVRTYEVPNAINAIEGLPQFLSVNSNAINEDMHANPMDENASPMP